MSAPTAPPPKGLSFVVSAAPACDRALEAVRERKRGPAPQFGLRMRERAIEQAFGPDELTLVTGARLLILPGDLHREDALGRLARWLAPSEPPQLLPSPGLFVLVASEPLLVARAATPFADRAAKLLYDRFGQGDDQLLVVSRGHARHQVWALASPSRVFGHEIVVRAAASSMAAWPASRRRHQHPRLRSLETLCIGDGRDPGLAELHLSAPAQAGHGPEVRVYFHLASSQRQAELHRYIEHLDRDDREAALAELAVHPYRHGARLALVRSPLKYEDVVRRCLRLQYSDRVRALLAAERPGVIARRRRRLALAHVVPADDTQLTGLALSGGGIRSATVSLGFMRALQAADHLTHYDYVSSVSGGSYASGYLQVMTTGQLLALTERPVAPEAMFDHAFEPANLQALHDHGSYLATGDGAVGTYNTLRLATSFTTSLLQHWLWLLAVLGLLGALGDKLLGGSEGSYRYVVIGVQVSAVLRFLVSRDLYVWRPRVQRLVDSSLNHVETWLLVFTLSFSLMCGFRSISSYLWTHLLQGWWCGLMGVLSHSAWPQQPWVAWLVLALFLTIVTSPNATSLHRYYSARLADAFLVVPSAARAVQTLARVPRLFQQVMPLSTLDGKDCYGPYPLFNACVNLAGDDPAFAGQQTGDYFVFSPKFCGSKLTGYAGADEGDQYHKLSLAEAVTCSGAAISPFQGRALPSAMSTLMWFFNLRTDLWLPNPARRRTGVWRLLGHRTVTWGPVRQLAALCGSLPSDALFVNVSDGAFIDSLGVYELLRRRCATIVAVDATMDPHYDFHELRNLVRRAHQELQVQFEFEPGKRPEEVIRPNLETGTSPQCVVHAKIRWPADEGLPDGEFYFVKSALLSTGPREAHTRVGPAEAYATYHPEFPQESTGDQFFDPVQWQAYHELGRAMGREFLKLRQNVEAQKRAFVP